MKKRIDRRDFQYKADKKREERDKILAGVPPVARPFTPESRARSQYMDKHGITPRELEEYQRRVNSRLYRLREKLDEEYERRVNPRLRQLRDKLDGERLKEVGRQVRESLGERLSKVSMPKASALRERLRRRKSKPQDAGRTSGGGRSQVDDDKARFDARPSQPFGINRNEAGFTTQRPAPRPAPKSRDEILLGVPPVGSPFRAGYIERHGITEDELRAFSLSRRAEEKRPAQSALASPAPRGNGGKLSRMEAPVNYIIKVKGERDAIVKELYALIEERKNILTKYWGRTDIASQKYIKDHIRDSSWTVLKVLRFRHELIKSPYDMFDEWIKAIDEFDRLWDESDTDLKTIKVKRRLIPLRNVLLTLKQARDQVKRLQSFR